MTTYVALLYSIILPKGRLVMSDLKAMATELGLGDPRTLVATGNLVFTAQKTTVAKLETQLEDALEKRVGKQIDIIVRTAADWQKTVKANPFGTDDPKSVAMRVQRDPLDRAILDDLNRFATHGEDLRIIDGDLWMRFAGNVSASKVTGALTKKRLGIGTTRALSTVIGLGKMLEAV
ncbi:MULTISPECIES: DUF1697 domain-containing protein [Asticcacaulis]|uniref:DUF1697 domain-containing protein n=1 Tax=Asticcacaulis TaxID=76890 RepID=UPI001AE6623A|nr:MULTISPECIES: DUF1697 domain-containing protein [Asticcacaulis]MBP2161517.1 uncharacterized protein (DUF1697 family) [Asticcacaulis solisilvae]MDR6802632.1 uncharacterized protein (DUF1697 family) [Asticcacaulis sp. BE141]